MQNASQSWAMHAMLLYSSNLMQYCIKNMRFAEDGISRETLCFIVEDIRIHEYIKFSGAYPSTEAFGQ